MPRQRLVILYMLICSTGLEASIQNNHGMLITQNSAQTLDSKAGILVTQVFRYVIH